MVQINFSILANTLSFLVLLYFVMKYLSGPITKLLDERADKIKESLTKAKAEEQRLKELKEDYSQKIQVELNAAKAVREDARRLAEEEKKSIIEEAKKNAEYLQLKAEKTISTEYENAKKKLEQEILTYAVAIAEKIVGREVDINQHRDLANRRLTKIGG